MDAVLLVDDSLGTLFETLTRMVAAAKLMDQHDQRSSGCPPLAPAAAAKRRDAVAHVTCVAESLAACFLVELRLRPSGASLSPIDADQGNIPEMSSAGGVKRNRRGKTSSRRVSIACHNNSGSFSSVLSARGASGAIHAFLVIPSQIVSELVSCGNFSDYLAAVCQATSASAVTLVVVNADGGKRKGVGYVEAAAEVVASHCSSKETGGGEHPAHVMPNKTTTTTTPLASPSTSQNPLNNINGGVKRTILFGSSQPRAEEATAVVSASLNQQQQHLAAQEATAPQSSSHTTTPPGLSGFRLWKVMETVHVSSTMAAAAHVLHSVRYLLTPANQKKMLQTAVKAASSEEVDGVHGLDGAIDADVGSCKLSKRGRKCESSDFHTLYKNMLEEITGCSSRQASLLATSFPTIRSLLESHASSRDGFIAKAARVLELSDSGAAGRRGVGIGVAKAVAQALEAPIGGDAAQLASLCSRANRLFSSSSSVLAGTLRVARRRLHAVLPTSLNTNKKMETAGAAAALAVAAVDCPNGREAEEQDVHETSSSSTSAGSSSEGREEDLGAIDDNNGNDVESFLAFLDRRPMTLTVGSSSRGERQQQQQQPCPAAGAVSQSREGQGSGTRVGVRPQDASISSTYHLSQPLSSIVDELQKRGRLSTA